ncbi:MAG: polysaccharide deacetylase family protein [Candidatus Polarisedimenticolia bacterium]
MIRRMLKGTVAAALSHSGGHRLMGRLAGASNPTLVLGYHRVVEDFPTASRHAIPSLLVSRDMLERHLTWVARDHRFVTLDEAARALCGRTHPKQPLAAVTFDDGYADVHDHALPLLTRMGIPATMFVATDLVGTNRPLVHDRIYALLKRALNDPTRTTRDVLRQVSQRMGFPSLQAAHGILSGDPLLATRAVLTSMPLGGIGHLARALEEEMGPADLGPDPPSPLSWEMIEALRAGGFTIGSHTRSHPFLTNETPARVVEEVRGSRARLQSHLRSAVKHFAYPDGRFDRTIVDAVFTAGYAHAWTVCHHRDELLPHLSLPRRLLWENACLGTSGRFSPSVMACCAAGAFDLLAPCRVQHVDAVAS